MFGGLGKAGWATILVAGGLVLGTSISAQAADLGGDCCADLEERVADLEATTARKGNRKVKLEIYGQVNQAVMFWDDGFESNAYAVTNDASRSRFGFKGGAKINNDWSANFKIEIGVRSSNSKRVTQVDPQGLVNNLDLRHTWWNLKSKTYGTFQVGTTPFASEEITEANLGGTNSVGKYSDVEDSGLGMRFRNSAGGLSAVQWYRLLKHTGDQAGEGDRRDGILYISPEFAGFTVSAAWGTDDGWDTALRYEGEFNGIKIEAGIAYGENTTNAATDDAANFACTDTQLGAHCRQFGGSISVMHEPTGIYANFAAGKFEDEDVAFANVAAQKDSTFWAGEVGIHKKWIEIGPTTFFAQYYSNDGGSNTRQVVAGGDAINSFGAVEARIYDSELEMFGLGIAQDLSKASMKLYALYRHYEADISLTNGTLVQDSRPLEDLDILMTGAIIKF
jgi:predicted porin